jgi:sugar/nucleoside kinase (ribokinase family)
MTSHRGILSAGNWCVDRVKIINRWPDQDTLCQIEKEEIGGGGSPFNMIVGMACLKPPFPLEGAGLLGKDAGGDFIISECAKTGVDTKQMHRTSSYSTSFTEVMTVRDTGRRTFFHSQGCNAFLGPEHFDPKNTNCKIFHLGHLLFLNKLDSADSEFGTQAARVLANYRKAGIKTNIDIVSELSDRMIKILVPALKYSDYCIVNELEAGHATSTETRRNDKIMMDGVKTAAKKLLSLGVHELVVIHFPEGAYALHKNGKECTQASLNLPQGYNKGAVGAGDAFCGGVLYGLHEDWSLEECLKLAVCNAAACLSHPTATGGMRPLKDTLGLFDQFGIRDLR